LIVLVFIYGKKREWKWNNVEDEIHHFNFKYSRVDIIVIAVIRATILFFVFSYQNQREWYEFNLLYGVIIALVSTGYGVLKLLADSVDEADTIAHADVDSVIFFIVGIYIEVLLFGLLRRKKIRIPNLAVAKHAMQRKVQSAYEKVSRHISHVQRNTSLSDIDAPMAIQRDSLMNWLETDLDDSIELERNDMEGKDSISSQKSIGNSLGSSPSLRSSMPHDMNITSDFSKYELPLYPTSSFLLVRGTKVHFRSEKGKQPLSKGIIFLCLHGFAGGVFSFNQC